jgi:formate--tetrahydrofolate ligase
MLPIEVIAEKLGIARDHVFGLGPHISKLKLGLLDGTAASPPGQLVLVTAITPTRRGEGKTVVSIGLAQALERLGKKAVVTLREPSLGPLLGVKGGGTGGGRSKALPGERINLHFTGDFHAVTAAHNLLAAAIDSHLFHGNTLGLVPDTLCWPRTVDMDDRALRRIMIGLGGPGNGVPRETGFIITAASEIMAILALSMSRADLRRRLEAIVIGYDDRGRPVRASELRITGAMMVLLNDAILPNLVQTTEGTPALIHAGPFANIAHGTSSVIAQRIGLRFADFVVNESGFGADLGAEKYFDIVMPASGIKPSVVVLVATVRGLAAHGARPGENSGVSAIERGLPNLARHIEGLRKFHVPLVVAINQFTSDTAEELKVISDFCTAQGIESAAADVFDEGGAGALDLAEKVVALAMQARQETVTPLYPADLSLPEKIAAIAMEIYGADGVQFAPAAQNRLDEFTRQGFGHLPVCMAKTQSSFSDDPKRQGAPTGWALTVSDARLSAGAGFVVAVAGDMKLMPGLPKEPRAGRMDVDEEGNITGVD